MTMIKPGGVVVVAAALIATLAACDSTPPAAAKPAATAKASPSGPTVQGAADALQGILKPCPPQHPDGACEDMLQKTYHAMLAVRTAMEADPSGRDYSGAYTIIDHTKEWAGNVPYLDQVPLARTAVLQDAQQLLDWIAAHPA
ncbi:hypothetical protein [Actinacidiphila sp. bgisy160]|uniref:hypothetical protein n=1 Tax=Actinacidiphila sp. bgisy160 TaxID=3413796 RepID=UPI003D760F21